jgi:thioredoxin-dependent peroxiredoxin
MDAAASDRQSLLMQLQKRDRAPAFEVHATGGTTVSLSTYAGKRLWLILSRYAACPFCSLRLDRIARAHDDVSAAGIDLLVIFPSPLERVEKYAEKFQPKFTVAADPEGATFEAYGAGTSWAGELKSAFNLPKLAGAIGSAKLFPLPIDGAIHQMPAEFLIDSSGTIAEVHYGREMDDGFAVETVLAWARTASRTVRAGADM